MQYLIQVSSGDQIYWRDSLIQKNNWGSYWSYKTHLKLLVGQSPHSAIVQTVLSILCVWFFVRFLICVSTVSDSLLTLFLSTYYIHINPIPILSAIHIFIILMTIALQISISVPISITNLKCNPQLNPYLNSHPNSIPDSNLDPSILYSSPNPISIIIITIFLITHDQ